MEKTGTGKNTSVDGKRQVLMGNADIGLSLNNGKRVLSNEDYHPTVTKRAKSIQILDEQGVIVTAMAMVQRH